MNPDVKAKFDSYPDNIRTLILELRDLIMEVANDEQINEVEETLKWGEPSYLAKGGSPIRMDWKERAPNNYYMYFNCNTKLVETFRELYANDLCFEGNRAIVLSIDEEIPRTILKHCISLALRYKSLKHLELLGE